MAADRIANPPTSLIPDFESAVDLAALGIDPNVLVCMQHPFLSAGSFIQDAQAADECVQIDTLTGTTVDIDDNYQIRRVRTSDRFYLLNPLDFDFDDEITVVLDSNPADKTFPINLYRRAIANTTKPINANEFRAYDTDAGATTEFSEFFGDEYNFKNYKALMKARNVIDPQSATDEDAVLFRSAQWGRAGEKYNVGYIYPTAASQGITSSVIVGATVQIRIALKSGLAVTNTIDGTTEWDVTITPNTPVAGVDEVTYTHNGTGTVPGLGTLAPGDYVTINNNGEFDAANQGTFRVSSATATSFTVRRPNGSALAETGIATLTINTISLYEDDDTTAQEIVDYVTANITDWIEAEIVDDNGSTGAGIIGLSTHEDNDFGSGDESVTLVDGINWILSSDPDAVAPAAQFIFKNTLSLPSFSTNTANAYAFNDGEEVRLIPTTVVQLVDFLGVLAVTGITTLGEVSTALRDQRLQLATQILGSGGAVRVSGGRGNISQAAVVTTSSKIANTDLMKVTIEKSASSGINVGSWLNLAASFVQKKDTGISFTTQVTITPNSPTPTTSTIELANRDVSDRYFGQPRNHVRTRGRAFHVEKHGALVNISWDAATGGNPILTKTVEFDDAGGGNMSVNYNGDFLTTEYIVQSGARNFSEVNIGDTVVAINFADAANNGTFKVKGVSDDGLTLSVDNQNGVSAGSAAVAAGDLVITTEVGEGDTVEIGSPFTNLNQGQFRVIRRYEDSIYIENDSAIEERVTVTDDLRSLGFDATTQFDVTVSGDMKIEWNTNGTQPDMSVARVGDSVTIGTGFAAANQGVFMITDSDTNYIKVAHSRAIPEVNVTVSGVGGDVLEAQIPSMLFSPYESTRAGDDIVISGNVLGENNQGTHSITDILSKTRVIVSGILEAQASVQLNDLFVQMFVQEGTAYTGYKEVFSKAVDPANSQQICLLFDNNNQVEKITEAGSILMTAQSKLGFTENNTTGFDSYKYHTGLIAQANKVTYGDPRDTVTFPGVAAAGAEIFIQPPLVRRVEVSVNIRVQTGVPFSRITEQVRNNVAALINSSPIGQPIAISDIISTVNSIPGVTAVSINSPLFDASNDVIVVNPSEKPFVLDIVNDIIVSKVG
jgi:hypothetical protein